eukprot:GHVU01115580.1.p1 GENE.GHVU01115580.1~~GHVU01115580.1.p1  ORF type:complete len:199 (-),score=27.88 GHVU01115580.1:1407-2003(-)
MRLLLTAILFTSLVAGEEGAENDVSAGDWEIVNAEDGWETLDADELNAGKVREYDGLNTANLLFRAHQWGKKTNFIAPPQLEDVPADIDPSKFDWYELFEHLFDTLVEANPGDEFKKIVFKFVHQVALRDKELHPSALRGGYKEITYLDQAKRFFNILKLHWAEYGHKHPKEFLFFFNKWVLIDEKMRQDYDRSLNFF